MYKILFFFVVPLQQGSVVQFSEKSVENSERKGEKTLIDENSGLLHKTARWMSW